MHWFEVNRSKSINWLSVCGVFLSFIGAVLMTDRLASVADTFGPFGNIEKGWNELISFRDTAADGRRISVLDRKEQGFQEVLDVILENRSGQKVTAILGIVNSRQMSLGVGSGTVDFDVISLVTPDSPQSKVDAVASTEVLREWIERARLRWVLTLGLVVVSIGFILGIVGHVVTLELNITFGPRST